MVGAPSLVAGEIARLAGALPLDRLEPLVAALSEASRVYLHAAGRSGNVMRMFAIRAVQIGLDVRLVGDATTTAINGDDLLLVASGSGETESVLTVAEQAQAIPVAVWALTASARSRLAQLAGTVIVLPGAPKTALAASDDAQPPGSPFEQMLFVFLEEAVLRLMRSRRVTAEHLANRHANLE